MGGRKKQGNPFATMASNPNLDKESKQNKSRKLKQKKWRQKVFD
jgi:hypothetical protein